jgi:transposase-like protein
MTDARSVFRGFRFPAEVILWAVRWYLRFPVSYRDLELMLADRGVEVDHTTMSRWVLRFAPELEKRIRRHLRPCRGPWHIDETYIRVDGRWRYLYRAVDGTGQTIDFLLSARRDKQAARRFFRRALGRANTRHPRTVVTDQLKSYPGAEPRRVCRRPRHLEGWGHDDEQNSEAVSRGAARARSAAGTRARGGASVAGGSDPLSGRQDRLQRRDAAAVGAPGRA